MQHPPKLFAGCGSFPWVKAKGEWYLVNGNWVNNQFTVHRVTATVCFLWTVNSQLQKLSKSSIIIQLQIFNYIVQYTHRQSRPKDQLQTITWPNWHGLHRTLIIQCPPSHYLFIQAERPRTQIVFLCGQSAVASTDTVTVASTATKLYTVYCILHNVCPNAKLHSNTVSQLQHQQNTITAWILQIQTPGPPGTVLFVGPWLWILT